MRLEQAQNVLDERRFAGAVLADQSDDGARRHAEAYVVERQFRAEAAGDVVDCDDRLGVCQAVDRAVRIMNH